MVTREATLLSDVLRALPDLALVLGACGAGSMAYVYLVSSRLFLAAAAAAL